MSIKHEFPFFQKHPELVYLDNAATSQKPQYVIDAVSRYFMEQNTNVHRSSFSAANDLTSLYESARDSVANFIGAKDASNIVWTKGTTEAINLIAASWAKHHIDTNDVIVVLGSEHHANFVPWQQLAFERGAQFVVVDILPNGHVDLAHFEQLMQLKPKLVAMQHCSNALGNIHPIKQLTQIAKSNGAIVVVDGAQAVAHLEVNVSDIGCDFYAFSGHKMYGPTGIGVLYIAEPIKSQMRPYQYGGEMISHVSKQATTFRPVPYLLETGTPNIAGIIGLKVAIEFLSQQSTLEARSQEANLYRYLVEKLGAINEVQIFGDTGANIGVVSFTVQGESVADVSALLDQQNIAVRSGHHCAMPLMASLGVNGTIRASLALYNDDSDVDKFIDALQKAIQLLEI